MYRRHIKIIEIGSTDNNIIKHFGLQSSDSLMSGQHMLERLSMEIFFRLIYFVIVDSQKVG